MIAAAYCPKYLSSSASSSDGRKSLLNVSSPLGPQPKSRVLIQGTSQNIAVEGVNRGFISRSLDGVVARIGYSDTALDYEDTGGGRQPVARVVTKKGDD